MDNIMSMAQGAYKQYEASQQGHQGQGGGDFGIQGSSALNSADNNRPPQENQSGGGGGFDFDQIASLASSHSGEDEGMFAQAMHFVKQGQHENNDIDEQAAQQAHAQAYGDQDSSNMSTNGLGAAAALQAMKKFTSGNQGQQQSQSSGGGGFQAQLISQAMAEASKLFDQNGGTGDGGSKQDAVGSAGKMALQLLLKSQASGAIGGANSGGLAGLMGMASKFM
ncbi:BZ3500_MvSof-1268-A1-R1_Chr7-1g09363 [Microbotryum saponariae]|uniref:BZ3500_MvSof-1268-A1-R1_Chr7-1g09363 protein n=1 Tax=Microbotryum saponariae TaxID=289078 RepID=A0A2X0KXZ2_9BASI|nr:BZ3501_MvSof-1269-A2-R1_Chr7-1g09068 [Microbotryum saponariae]SDA03298.1 BZ3500_MvSof-1268-A1-R1_Chr7-1g09363 [Microbotryum saponariae]